MRRIAVLMFWLSVLATTCCGCRFCGVDWDRSKYNDQTMITDTVSIT